MEVNFLPDLEAFDDFDWKCRKASSLDLAEYDIDVLAGGDNGLGMESAIKDKSAMGPVRVKGCIQGVPLLCPK